MNYKTYYEEPVITDRKGKDAFYQTLSKQGDDFAITKKKLERLPEWSHHKVK